MSEQPPERRRLWAVGLRRSWVESGALGGWIAERGVTGAVWTPATYEVEDLARAASRLVEAGAQPDDDLLWDLATTDVRGAADRLRGLAADGDDGFVAVWAPAAALADARRAVAEARRLLGDVRRANVAFAFAWTPKRGHIVQALIAQGMPVALSGAHDPSPIVAAHTAGMAELRKSLEESDTEADQRVPVFLLDAPDATADVVGVDLTDELSLYVEGLEPVRPPAGAEAERQSADTGAQRLAQRARAAIEEDVYGPVDFARAVAVELGELQEDGILDGMWSRDHTLWRDEPTEIADRLGWLESPERLAADLKDIESTCKRLSGRAKRVVLCGMGGSSFAARTIIEVLGAELPLLAADTTDPALLSSLEIDDDTVVVIASKSGTTIETRAHLDRFWTGDGSRFVAITDAGSDLEAVAKERGFAHVFTNPPDIGGRFSALSLFGVVPAALCRADLRPLIYGARRAVRRNAPSVAAPNAPGVRLAAALGEAAMSMGRDKLTVVLPPRLAALGPWLEQLVAESTGKDGRGVLPVVNESFEASPTLSDDRVFCIYTVRGEDGPSHLDDLEEQHPVIRITVEDHRAIGEEMYRWMVATAVLGYLLDVNPFDQPDVESAKQRTAGMLGATDRPERGSAPELVAGLQPPSYVAIQAFVSPTPDNATRLSRARDALRRKLGVAVTWGFGPGYLHSTGQYHKGGPAHGVFLQVVQDRAADLDIPGRDHTFGRLFDAQADGDLLTLRERERPVARLTLDELDVLVG